MASGGANRLATSASTATITGNKNPTASSLTIGGQHRKDFAPVNKRTSQSRQIPSAKQGDNHSTIAASKKVAKAFFPCRIVMWALGRFPVSLEEKQNGAVRWVVKKYSACNIIFIVNSIFHFFIFLMFIINGIGITLNAPQIAHESKNQTERSLLHLEEWFLFRRNSLPYTIALVSSLHIVVCSWNWIWKREFIADFFNFWATAEHQMRLTVTHFTVGFSVIVLTGYGILLICLCSVIIIRATPICTGAPAILVQMILRCFFTDVHTWESFSYYRIMATFLFLYIMICAKIHVIFFMVQCNMIKYTIRQWNNRVEEALNSDKERTPTELLKTRSTGTMLFQDQVCILDLIDGTDIIFTNAIESYYLSEVITMIFEVYFIYRIDQNAGDFHGVRKYDVYLVSCHLIFTILFMLLVSIVAGQVGEETLNGIQSVRNKGLLGRKDEATLNLVLSMYYDYVGFWEAVINGGKYFPINKQLFMKSLAACMTYVFCLIQFEMGFRFIKDPLVPYIDFETMMSKVESVNAEWWGDEYKKERYLDKTEDWVKK